MQKLLQWIIAEIAMKYCAAIIALNYGKYKRQIIVVCAFNWSNKIAVKVMQILKVKFALNLTSNTVVKIMQILKEKFVKFVKFALDWINDIAVKYCKYWVWNLSNWHYFPCEIKRAPSVYKKLNFSVKTPF